MDAEQESPKRAKFGISFEDRRKFLRLWKAKRIRYFICIITPFALLPLAISRRKEARCAYVILWMIIYWLLEPVNISATSLLPVPLMPLLGIMDSSEVAPHYMKEVLMFFIGGLGVAIAVEYCNLHERIALLVLVTIGTDTMWLILGFMSTSMFLSLWISNSAATAMMVPIIEALITELEMKSTEIADENEAAVPAQSYKVLHKTLLLCVAYSCTLGGTGTLTGTPPNMIFKGFIEEQYPKSSEVTFATWMAYNIPGMLICVAATWLILQVIYIPFWKKTDEESKQKMRSIIQARYDGLGRMSFHEASVLALFSLLVILWIFREPRFMPGWAELIGSGKKIGDVVPAIAVLFLMFILPSQLKQVYKSPPLLDWKVFVQKMPWGLVLLIGGGYAMADGSEKSGLSRWMGTQLIYLRVFSPSVVLVFVLLIISSVTEVMSNAAVVSIFLPVVNEMAKSFHVNPIYLTLPVTIVSSHAFMLAVGTGPNAIVYKTGRLKTLDMVKAGIAVNIVAFLVQILSINTWGRHLFNLDTFPRWANSTLTTNSTSVGH